MWCDGITRQTIWKPLEAMVCREAFALADDLYVRKVLVMTDCATNVKHLHSEYCVTESILADLG